MTYRDDLRVAKSLQGADFPRTRQQVLDYARERDADEKTLEAMRALPERTYDDRAQVVRAVPQEPEGDRPGGIER
ncbi:MULTISPECIES: DUF2795 domain-containing protein [Pseudonocardia]|uniref:DUF2795 domain-containing protein n=2 Tax=Pseudonocardia TaxID=1847 RepID=A0A1Y2MN23_PSEAH|nr:MULTISPECIES: DUF2795 domain-containing protein [Pseudonocardia]OSY36389.1 hypothetical protein BG845_05466 [Pseudonocardia autotrophica]TDN72655.1 uncharacterized protein DUF2795 [Pseudonocardia autotrophica]BBG03368.1 hypothetical protein Pdca_45770 [Pseudonocardia autotrophica]GEC29595.1 hypothetical protein PSA01_66240 [Pseudonocardia saturnea]